MALRRYTTFDLIRFRNFAKDNEGLKPVELIKAYNEKYPELTAKEKLINISKALGIDNLHKALTGENIPEGERWEYDELEESVLPISGVVFSEERSEVCKRNEHWKECVTWTNDCRCIKSCDLHKQT